jgi:hypothetical protein
MLMAILLAVRLPEGEMLSQFTAVQVFSRALAVKAVALAAVTISVCDAGGLPPGLVLNVIASVLNVSKLPLLLPLTFRVTLTVSGLFETPAAMTVMTPE